MASQPVANGRRQHFLTATIPERFRGFLVAPAAAANCWPEINWCMWLGRVLVLAVVLRAPGDQLSE
jgi:hypothetical protein